MKRFSLFVFVCSAIALLLFASQYAADPSVSDTSIASTLVPISRAVFGERCWRTYRIDSRADAEAYARKFWKKEQSNIALLHGEIAAKAVFDAPSFRDESGKDRSMANDGWLVTRPGPDIWRLSYAAFDPFAVYLSVEFTGCGRIVSSGSKIFMRPQLFGRRP